VDTVLGDFRSKDIATLNVRYRELSCGRNVFPVVWRPDHATRRFLANDCVLVKLDFSNAFNSIQRVVFLIAVANTLPYIYHICFLAYQPISILKYRSQEVESKKGAQQGDPLGPLLFCFGMQSLLTSLANNLAFGYLDDVTLGGPIATVSSNTPHSSAIAQICHVSLSDDQWAWDRGDSNCLKNLNKLMTTYS